MQNLNSLNNLNALGIKGFSIFDPSQITVDGNKTLSQQVLTKTAPTLAGVISDESKNKGDARDIQLGRAYNLDGTNDYVNIPDNTDLDITDNLSVTVRVKSRVSPVVGQDVVIAKYDVGLNKREWYVEYTSANKISIIFSKDGTSTAENVVGYITDDAVTVDSLNTIGFTFNSGVFKFYVNGILTPTTIFAGTPITTIFNSNAPLTIGCALSSGTPASFFDGQIFDARIYDTTILTASDMLAIHNNTVAPADVSGRLVAHYKCDEQSGLTAYDSSGNGRHGTIINATLSTFHSTQDTYSFQNEVGYTRRMYFDGTNDYVKLDSVITLNSDFDITINCVPTNNAGHLLSSTTSKIRLFYANASATEKVCFQNDVAGGITVDISWNVSLDEFVKNKLRFVRTGTTIEFFKNDISQGTRTWGDPFIFDGVGSKWSDITGVPHFNGIIESVKIGETHLWENLSNSNADWTDKIGSNNGTVNGSPSNLFLPRNEAIITEDVLGNTLQYAGRVPYNAKAEQSNCISVNGTTQYVSVADNTDLDITNNLSVVVRAKNNLANMLTDQAVIAKYDSGTNNREWEIVVNSAEKVVVILSNDGSNAGVWVSTNVITTNQVNTLGFAFQGGQGGTGNVNNITVYVNGVEIAGSVTSGTIPDALHTGPANLTIGVNLVSGAGNGHWSGQIFDARIYDTTVLTASEMLAIHNGTDTTVGANLVAHYPITEDAGSITHDVSGNENHGTLINAPTWAKQDSYHYNLVGGCSRYANLNGTSQYIQVADNTDLNIANNLSVTIRAKNDLSDILVQPILIGKYDYGNNRREWSIAYTVDEKLLIAFGDPADGTLEAVWESTNVITVNQAHSVGLTFQGGQGGTGNINNVKVYVDGVEIAGSVTSGTIPNTLYNGTSPVCIGTQLQINVPINFFDGQLWDARIYDTTILTPAEMLAIHNGTDTTVGANLVARYEGNGATSADWVDLSGNGNNGSLIGSPSTIYIPAVSETLDAFGEPLRNPAGAYHNRAETLIDFTNNVLSPEAVKNSWETAWAFNTARVNPEFKRTLTSGGIQHRADRFLAYREALSGTNLTKVQNYTETKAI